MIFRRWVTFVCLSVFLGCAESRHQLVSDIGLKDALRHNADKITAFRGGGKLHLSFGHKEGVKEGVVDVLIVAEKPDHLRIETGSFWGYPLSALTLYQGKLNYYQIPQEKFYEGTAKMMFKVLPFKLSDQDILGLLFFKRESIEKFQKNSNLKLSVYELRKDEKQNLYYPTGFELKDSKTNDFIEILWDEFDLNMPPISVVHFRLDCPAQAQRLSLIHVPDLEWVFEETKPEDLEEEK